LFVHVGLDNYVDEYINTLENAYFEHNNFEYNFVIAGHTHNSKIEHFGKYTYLNPSSFGSQEMAIIRQVAFYYQKIDLK